MGDLTENFSLDEFLVSSKAAALGIANTPTKEHLRRIKKVTAPGMQLVRDLVARAMVLTSGYRNPELNEIVGGVPTSDHAEAYAVDCRAAGLSAYGLAKLIAQHMKPGGKLYGKIDQLILETSRSVVHISFAPRMRMQLLRIDSTGTRPWM
jgi:hypothetical protein